MSPRHILRAAIVAAAIATATGAAAASPGISVRSFTSEKTCTLYELEWGREVSAAAASSQSAVGAASDGYGAAVAGASASREAWVYAREWGTELRRECVQNFPNLRSTVAAALASAGPVDTGGQALSLDGRLTNVGYSVERLDSGGSSFLRGYMLVSFEHHLRNAAGQIVFGGVITKRLLIQDVSDTTAIAYANTQAGRTTFGQIQQQVGLALARSVIFHLSPPRVTGSDGGSVSLSYGAPLIPVGATVLAPTAAGGRIRRLTVVGSVTGQATAESDGGISLADVPVGAVVTFVEAEDPAARARVFDRVALPEN